MKMPKLEVKPPRGTTIHVRGKSLAICVDPSDIRQITQGSTAPINAKIAQSIIRMQAETIPIAKIIVTGKVLKHVKEAMVFAHDQFKRQMGKAESHLYKKESHKDENCYQLVYTYHVLSTPVGKTPDEFYKELDKAAKNISKSEDGVVKVHKSPKPKKITDKQHNQEMLNLFLETSVNDAQSKLASHENMITFVNNNYTDTRLEVDALRKLTTKLYRSIMGCLFLISGLALTIAIMQAGLTDPYVIGAGVAILGLWSYIGMDSILLPWLRKRKIFSKTPFRCGGVEFLEDGCSIKVDETIATPAIKVLYPPIAWKDLPESVRQCAEMIFKDGLAGYELEKEVVKHFEDGVKRYAKPIAPADVAGLQIGNPEDFYTLYCAGAPLELCVSRFRQPTVKPENGAGGLT